MTVTFKKTQKKLAEFKKRFLIAIKIYKFPAPDKYNNKKGKFKTFFIKFQRLFIPPNFNALLINLTRTIILKCFTFIKD
ncbi:hypothetical protein MAPG_11240 [Magnaporthiopsis poae ATCC 64411]|uniref:Uncharacterized protein n=1 Tax=Magnaporthiopsis poae (strain ATCC 64411 / 73-15) TaxID=644358 RepID=A0A0C4EER2_MAGP6|nr:hypothetical protein MAPG_11240 [Magnaporthiopsis poae ATCC 64411]